MVRFDLRVHYLGDQYSVWNVDSDGYCLLRLLTDCCQVALGTSENYLGDLVEVCGIVPGSDQLMPLLSDTDVQALFTVYKGSRVVHVEVRGLPLISQVTQVHVPQLEAPLDSQAIAPHSIQPPTSPFVGQCPEVAHLSSDSLNSPVHQVNIDDEEIFQWTDDDQDFDGWKQMPVEEFGTSSQGGESANNGDALSGYQSNNDEAISSGTEKSDVETPLARLSRNMKGKEFKTNEKGEVEFQIGQAFQNVDHFRKILKDYVIQEGFTLERVKNERTRVTCKCSETDCPWRIHASPMPDGVTYKVKSYNPLHTCLRNSKDNSEATSGWIAEKLERELRRNPEMSLEHMADDLRDIYHIECCNTRLYRARKKARERLEGDYVTSYNKLPAYTAVLREWNPGTLVKLAFQNRHYDQNNNIMQNPIFKRFFIAFPSIRNGFLNGCKPFIGVDGCHLKGPFKGMFLSVVALDANSGMVPLAVMVVKGESTYNWGYFLNLLDTWIGQSHKGRLTFMSDRQKGVLTSIAKFFPNAQNRYCARHMYSNFQGKFPGVMHRSLFWGAVRATNESEFNKNMNEMKAKYQKAYEWMMETPTLHWSVHLYDESVKSDHTSNNMTESFNAWLGKHRSKPVLTLLENIRRKVMRRIHRRHEKAVGWTFNVPPTVRKRLEVNKKESRKCELYVAGGPLF